MNVSEEKIQKIVDKLNGGSMTPGIRLMLEGIVRATP